MDANDDRMGLSTLRYPVPGYANTIGWSRDALTLISFVVLLITGVIRIQCYSSDPVRANQSILGIVTTEPGQGARPEHTIKDGPVAGRVVELW